MYLAKSIFHERTLTPLLLFCFTEICNIIQFLFIVTPSANHFSKQLSHWLMQNLKDISHDQAVAAQIGTQSVTFWSEPWI